MLEVRQTDVFTAWSRRMCQIRHRLSCHAILAAVECGSVWSRAIRGDVSHPLRQRQRLRTESPASNSVEGLDTGWR